MKISKTLFWYSFSIVKIGLFLNAISTINRWFGTGEAIEGLEATSDFLISIGALILLYIGIRQIK